MQKIARCFRSKIRIQIRSLLFGWLVLSRLETIVTASEVIPIECTKIILFLKKNEKHLFIFASLLKAPEEEFFHYHVAAFSAKEIKGPLSTC